VQHHQDSATLPGSRESSGRASQKDWFELINNALKFGNTMAGMFQQAGGTGGSEQGNWNQPDWSS
jgi:hypothetical protein